MPTPALAPRSLHRRAPDPLREAVSRLAEALPQRADATVLLDFLEDDLREGLGALGDVEAHFTDVLDALRSPRPSPAELLAVGDDLLALQRLESLLTVVSQLRRRLSQAAGMLHREGR
ncbi:MAG TPA: hypothetical protein VFO83_09690 [Aggregicoccus sp.]|nr:hypothetical protein [Aggregicoccus sp.]